MSGVLLFFFSPYSKSSSAFKDYSEKWQYPKNTQGDRELSIVWAAAPGQPCRRIPELRHLGTRPNAGGGSWKLAASPLPDTWWEMLSPQGWMRTGWIFLPNMSKNSYLPPKLESLLDWQRLDPDQVFRFDSDSAEYLLVNILTGAGHLAILK